jgi:hypothetical protein
MKKKRPGKRRALVKDQEQVKTREQNKLSGEEIQPGENNYGGIDLKNFTRNLGCGG